MDKPSSPLPPHYQLQQQPQVIVQYQEQHPQFGQAGVQYIYVQAPPPQTIPDLDEIEAKTLNVSYAVLTGFALALFVQPILALCCGFCIFRSNRGRAAYNIGCGLGGIIVGIVELIVSHVIRSQADQVKRSITSSSASSSSSPGIDIYYDIGNSTTNSTLNPNWWKNDDFTANLSEFYYSYLTSLANFFLGIGIFQLLSGFVHCGIAAIFYKLITKKSLTVSCTANVSVNKV
ncbi:hypothetical protein HDU92_006053 [Lobulomyces angularis]|nr:hypothetical protein HDU92_006053 [Lobulomyces angularis]